MCNKETNLRKDKTGEVGWIIDAKYKPLENDAVYMEES